MMSHNLVTRGHKVIPSLALFARFPFTQSSRNYGTGIHSIKQLRHRRDHVNHTSCKDSSSESWWETASVYVHWPYCNRRCSYCNFNKYVAKSIDQERMGRCLVTELRTLVELSGIKRVHSVFFGGGTPSIAEPRVLGAVISALKEMVAMPTDVEITMEANPTSLEMEKLEQFKVAGVNRLSLGIQALRSSDLVTLGRDHTVDQSQACILEAKKLFPSRVSLDFIFGRPGQTLESWESELGQILDICDDHISLYQLTLEPGTLLYKMHKQGILNVPDSDSVAEMYETAVRSLTRAGFHRYEVSNFARGPQAESQHNKAYWEGRQYIGVGPGAHGRFCPITDQRKLSNENSDIDDGHESTGISKSSKPSVVKDHNHSVMTDDKYGGRHFKSDLTLSKTTFIPQREARIQTLEPENWMVEVERYGHATRKRTLQSNGDILRELLLVGLRIPNGIRNETWDQFSSGTSLTDLFGTSQFMAEVVDSGLMSLDSGGLRCTDRGLNLLDSLAPNLIEILDSHLGERGEM